MKRSFTEWLSGSKANAELPCPPEKKSDSEFFKGVWNFSRRIYCTNFKFKNRSYPAETGLKNTKNYAVIFSSRRLTDEVKRMLHGVAKRKRGNAEFPYPPEKKSGSDFFKGV